MSLLQIHVFRYSASFLSRILSMGMNPRSCFFGPVLVVFLLSIEPVVLL